MRSTLARSELDCAAPGAGIKADTPRHAPPNRSDLFRIVPSDTNRCVAPIPSEELNNTKSERRCNKQMSIVDFRRSVAKGGQRLRVWLTIHVGLAATPLLGA